MPNDGSRDPGTLDAIAGELLGLLGTGRQVAPISARHPGFGAAEAAAVAGRLSALRAARGERAVGRKIGFTNTTIWERYGVAAPLWNHVFDATVHDPAPERFGIGRLAEPRIEPEIVLHLAAPPHAGMTDGELAACVDWIAHGFELVQAVFPGWVFTGADATAAYGLHGALLVGPHRAAGLPEAFSVKLMRGGVPVARGDAAHVLGGPLKALRHLVATLAAEPGAPPLAAGEIVTTGTLTDAFPVVSGETWSTRFEGIDLPGLSVTVV
jgi:2-oxo-3-hexenedioate decarboxylase